MLNPSPRTRDIIYIVFTVGSLIATYLGAKQIVGPDEIALWTGLSSFAFAMAKINTPSDGEEGSDPDLMGG